MNADGSNQSGGLEPSLKHSNSTSSLCSTSFVSTDSSDLPGSRLDDVVPSSSKNNSDTDGIQTKKAVSDKALLKKPVTTDAVRLKCIALILAALTSQRKYFITCRQHLKFWIYTLYSVEI